MGAKGRIGLDRLAGREGVVLDTMVFIYLYEDHPVYADVCESIVREASEGRFTGVVTPITEAELLVKPVQKRRFTVADRYRRAITSHPNIVVLPLDISTGFLAGSLRATYGLPLPDMFQAAIALQQPAQTLLTNDRALKRVSEIEVILLDEM